MQAAVAPLESPASYPIGLALRYQLLAHVGAGQTVSLSSMAVVFEASESLPIDRPVKLWINWPVKLENRLDLTLEVRGRTTRAQGHRTTVEIQRYEFLIRPAA